ncbi:MAG: MraY family glycosyltransferase [Syntrophomonadaceae bacterium]|nr:MraY family glycosyltransferase [Syntrophomonadaceae bacterium]
MTYLASMSTLQPALAVAAAFLLALLSTPLVIRLARRVNAVDRPDDRKVHQTAMPRIGGCALFLAFIIPAVFILKAPAPLSGIVLGGIIIFIVGLLDDIYQISPWLKLLGQCLAAVVAMSFGVIVYFVTNPFEGIFVLGNLALPLTFLWIVGITNAINLIDGLDGLAAGISAIAAATMGVVALMQGEPPVFMMSMVLVAAVLGFLPYNFYPAKTFMGDSGSNFLGFVLACLAVCGMTKSTAVISLIIPIIVLGIPILDTLFAIVRRLNNRTPIFRPDKDHLHHRLMALGLSHRSTVLVIYVASAFFGGLAITFSHTNMSRVSLLLALVLIITVAVAEKIGLRTGTRPEPSPVPEPDVIIYRREGEEKDSL